MKKALLALILLLLIGGIGFWIYTKEEALSGDRLSSGGKVNQVEEVEEVMEVEEAATEPVVFETMMDYYLNMPLVYLPNLSSERKETDVMIQDEENYYLTASILSQVTNVPVTMTLFLRDEESPLTVVEYRNTMDEGRLFFLEYVDGAWVDQTEYYLPEIDWTYLADYFEGDLDDLVFTLPRYGTEITARGNGVELFTLNWKKGRFALDYSVGESAAPGIFRFTSGNGFSLEFPDTWEAVEVVYDFSGFGRSPDGPMCNICGHSAGFGFKEGLYDGYTLFDVVDLPLEYKGHADIPPEYSYLGESACDVYYGSIVEGEDQPATSAEFKKDITGILDSFEIIEISCPE